MRQPLSLQNIMSMLRQRWATVPDTRKPNNNTKYTVADGVLAAFAVFFMQSSSFLAHQRLLQSKKGRSNARSLFQIEQIPSDQQIRNLVDLLASTYFQDDFWSLLDELTLLDRPTAWKKSHNGIGMANMARFGNISLPNKFHCAMARMPCWSIGWSWSLPMKLQGKSCIKTAL